MSILFIILIIFGAFLFISIIGSLMGGGEFGRGRSIMPIATGMIGIGVTIMVGFLVIGQVSNALGCDQTTNQSIAGSYCESFGIFDLFEDVTIQSSDFVEVEPEYVPPPKIEASDIIAVTNMTKPEDFDFSMLDDGDLLSVDLE